MFGRRPELPDYRTIAATTLLDMVRAYAPDFRMRSQRLPDGRRAYAAWFTCRGRDLSAQAIEGECETPDARDSLIRRCAWLVAQTLGVRVQWFGEVDQRSELERSIRRAMDDGDTATVDRLGAVLVRENEARWRPPLRIPWEL